ncbi:hypothetical protein ACFJGW_19425 [Burkholderiaceae bacterium UC74_6]
MRKIRNLVVVAVATLVVLGCSTPAPPRSTTASPGETKATAVEVCMPLGERKYLSRLQCPNGSTPTFERAGSVGLRTQAKGLTEQQLNELLQRDLAGKALRPGDPDLHVIDAYVVSCGAEKHTVHLDMYHCEQAEPDVAPSGFQLRK